MGNVGLKNTQPGRMQRPFEEIKKDLTEEVILHLRDPKHFGLRRFSHEEISIMFSPDKESVMSRMAYCIKERNTLAKIKSKLSKLGISSISDAFDYRKNGSSVSSAYAPPEN